MHIERNIALKAQKTQVNTIAVKTLEISRVGSVASKN
jgi:hypothetical protein